MTSITFGHVGRGTAAPDRRRARVAGEAVVDRNTHRAAGWAIAITATVGIWGCIGGAVVGITSIL